MGPWSGVKSSQAPPGQGRPFFRRRTRTAEDRAGVPNGFEICAGTGSESSGDPNEGSKSRAVGDSRSKNSSEASVQALCVPKDSADVPEGSR